MAVYYIVHGPGDEPQPMPIIDGEPRLLDPDDIVFQNGGPVSSGTGISVTVTNEQGVSVDGFMSTEPYYYLDEDGHCFEIPPGSICTGEEWDYSDDDEVEEGEEEREMSDNIKSMSIGLRGVGGAYNTPSSFALPLGGGVFSTPPSSLLSVSSTITHDLPYSLSATGATGWNAQRNGSVDGFGVDGELRGTIFSLPDTEDTSTLDASEVSSSQSPEFDNFVSSNDATSNLAFTEAYVEHATPITVEEQLVEEVPSTITQEEIEYAPVTMVTQEEQEYAPVTMVTGGLEYAPVDNTAHTMDHVPDSTQVHIDVFDARYNVYSHADVNNAAVVTEEIGSYPPDYGDEDIRDAPDVTVQDFIDTELGQEISVGVDTDDIFIPNSFSGTSKGLVPSQWGEHSFPAAQPTKTDVEKRRKSKKIKSPVIPPVMPVSKTSSINYCNPLEIPETVLVPKTLPPAKLMTSAQVLKQGVKSPTFKTTTPSSKVSKSPEVLPPHSPEMKPPTSGRGRKKSTSDKKLSETKSSIQEITPSTSERKLLTSEGKLSKSEKKASMPVSATARLTQSVSKQRNVSAPIPAPAPTPLAAPRDLNVRASGRARRANSRFTAEEFEYTGDRSIAHFSGSGGDSESDTTSAGRVTGGERARKPSQYEEYQKLIADAKIFSDSLQQSRVQSDRQPRRRRSSKKSLVPSDDNVSTNDAGITGANFSTTTGASISTTVSGVNISANDYGASVDMATVDTLNVDVATINLDHNPPSNEELMRYLESYHDQPLDVMNVGDEEEVVVEEMVVATSTDEQLYFSGGQSLSEEVGQFGGGVNAPSAEYIVANEHSLMNTEKQSGEQTTALVSENQTVVTSKDENKSEESISMILPSLMPIASTSTESFVEVNVTDDIPAEDSLNLSSNIFSESNTQQLHSGDLAEPSDEPELVIDFTPPHGKSVKGSRASGASVKRGRGRQKKIMEDSSMSPTHLTAPVNVQMFNSPPPTPLANEPSNKDVHNDTLSSPTPVKRGRGRPPRNLTPKNVTTTHECKIDNSGSLPNAVLVNTDIIRERQMPEFEQVLIATPAAQQIDLDGMETTHAVDTAVPESHLNTSYLNVTPTVYDSSAIHHVTPTVDNSSAIHHSTDPTEPTNSTSVISGVPLPTGVLDHVRLVNIPSETTILTDSESSPHKSFDSNLTSTSHVVTSPDIKTGRRWSSYKRKSEVSATPVNPVSPAVTDAFEQTSSTVTDDSVVDKSVPEISKQIDWEQSDMKFEEDLAEIMGTKAAADADNYCTDPVSRSSGAVLTAVPSADGGASSEVEVEIMGGTLGQKNEEEVHEEDVELSSKRTADLNVFDRTEVDEVSVSIKSTPIIDMTPLDKRKKTKREYEQEEELKQVDILDVVKDLDTETLTTLADKTEDLHNVSEADVSTSVKKRRGRPPRKSIVPPEVKIEQPIKMEVNIEKPALNQQPIEMKVEGELNVDPIEPTLERAARLDDTVSTLQVTDNIDVTEYVVPKVDDDVIKSEVSSVPSELVGLMADMVVTEDMEVDVRDSYVTTQTESRFTTVLSDREESCDSFAPSGAGDQYAPPCGAGDADGIGQSFDVEAMLSAGIVVDSLSVLNAMKANAGECTILEHQIKSRENVAATVCVNCNESFEVIVSNARSVSNVADKKREAVEREYNVRWRELIRRENKLRDEIQLRKKWEAKERQDVKELRRELEVDLENWKKIKTKQSLRRKKEKRLRDASSDEIQSERKKKKKNESDSSRLNMSHGGADGDKLDAEMTADVKPLRKSLKIKKESSERTGSSSKSSRERSSEMKHSSKRQHESLTSSEVHREGKNISLVKSETSLKHRDGQGSSASTSREGQGFSASTSREEQGSSAMSQEAMCSSGKYDDEKTMRKNLAGLRALQSKIQMRVQRGGSKESTSEHSEVEIGSDVARSDSRAGTEDMLLDEPFEETKESTTAPESQSKKSTESKEPVVITSRPGEFLAVDQLYDPPSNDDELVVIKRNSLNVDGSGQSRDNPDTSSSVETQSLMTFIPPAQSCPMEQESSSEVVSETVTSTGAEPHVTSVSDDMLNSLDVSNNILSIALMSPGGVTTAPDESVPPAGSSLSTSDPRNVENIANPAPHTENIVEDNIDDLEVSFRTGGMSP